MAEAYGASLEAWHHWSERLGLVEHLLPVVANPGATISPDSNMKALGKTPSRYNFRRQVAGFAKWTEQRSTLRDVGKWELEPDYGICVQARAVRAFDIDVPRKRMSKKIVDAIESALPLHFFSKRYREGTGKVLLPFLYEGDLTKHVLNVDGGVVEVLADGQQWIAESTYIKNREADGRYLWQGGWPTDFPVLSETEFAEVIELLEMLFGDEDGWTIARQRREGGGVDNAPRPGGDEIENWLLANWEVREEGRGGELFIRCPFDEEHTSDSGPSETAYFPAGTGGYEKGHFKCLHAHCMRRDDADYLFAMGFEHDLSDAPDLPAQSEADEGTPGRDVLPRTGAVVARYMLDKQGRKEPRAYNHRLFLSDPENTGWRIAWDDFSAQMVWCPAGDAPGKERWSLFSDEHYVKIVEQMDRNGFVTQSATTIRPAVHAHAMRERVDLAIAWGERLPKWDGVERIERFWIDYAGAAESEYMRAVGLYSWTAQAARLLDPGCQADMAPILVGEQGMRKTSFIGAIAPSREMFAEINLMDRDEDTSRLMRGKLVAELGELRGMHSRDKEDVKAFITRREEEWIPKYREFGTKFKRRFVFYGTTNKDEILADATGERRWLPFRVEGDKLDVDRLVADRDQLWAEGIARWKAEGVLWQDAERLAVAEHGKFKEHDPWTPLVVRWLLREGALSDADLAPVDMPYEWGSDDVLVGALGKRAADIGRGDQMRVGALLKTLGCHRKKVWGVGNQYRAYRDELAAAFTAGEE